MVLLHHLVVPGLGDGTRSQPATAVRGDRAAPLVREDAAVPAVAAEAGSPPPADTVCAA